MNWQFQHKEFIWLFAGLLFLLFLFARLLFWKRTTLKKIGDTRLIKALINNYSSFRFNLKFIAVSVAFVAGIAAAMDLRKPGGQDSEIRKGIDIAIALDVSKSMLATDYQPSRLERARQFINKLIDQMPNDRIALVLFAGKAYLQMPLTVDHGAAKLYISSAAPTAVPQQGTFISDALKMSARVFNPKERRFKSIILISDGEDHDEEALNTAKELADEGVMINTVGIGSQEGSTLIDPATGELKRDETGNVVVSKLNEQIMDEIANATNGIYIHLQGSDEAVAGLMKQLSQIDRKAFGDVSLMNFKVYYMWFAAGMFLLLLLENFITERKKIIA
jgi:Ca-activated chloride channel family protein